MGLIDPDAFQRVGIEGLYLQTRGRAEQQMRRALLTLDGEMRLPGERMLLLTAGAVPIPSSAACL